MFARERQQFHQRTQVEHQPRALHLSPIQITESVHLRNNPVIEVCNAIKDYVQRFESDLDEEHEVGVRLASFGGIVVFHAQTIGFSAPNVITFTGVTDQDEKVQLIQHVSQLNFLLKTVKKRAEKATRIGFI